MKLLVEEIRLLEARIAQLERELTADRQAQPGLHHAAAVDSGHWPADGHRDGGGHLAAMCSHFKDARHFASWFGLTPKEYSSGSTRYLGRISKRGDRYLRMLLTHGARSVLRSARWPIQPGAGTRWRARLGAGGAGPYQPQQGGLCAGQQAGAHLLRDAAGRGTFRPAGQSAEQEDRTQAFGCRMNRP